MAKDVASRVSGDDASAPGAREGIERAAAQFPSIHDRWAALKASERPSEGSPEATLSEGATPISEPVGTAAVSELDRERVSVTPILGIATSDDSEPSHRPRFKTLMGVPRSSPDIDALAGIELDAGRRRDTVRLERPPPLVPAPTVKKEAPARSNDEPSLAATSWPWERNAPAPRHSPRAVPPQWSALVESSLDVSQEVAALRASHGWRYWFAGAGAVAAVVALFAFGAPRERTLALRWLRHEYEARVHPSVEAITDSARALRVAAVPGTDEAPGAASPALTAALLGAPAVPTGADDSPATQGVPTPRSSNAAAPTAAAVPVAAASALASIATLVAAAPARSSAGAHEGGARAKASPSSSTGAAASSPALHDASNASGNTSKARQQVAAARKHGQHPAALAGSATKPRATRQNSPRKEAGGGIIRETPF